MSSISWKDKKFIIKLLWNEMEVNLRYYCELLEMEILKSFNVDLWLYVFPCKVWMVLYIKNFQSECVFNYFS